MKLTGKDLLLLLLYAPVSYQDESNVPISGRTRLAKMVFIFKKEVLPLKDFEDLFEADELPEFFAWKFGPYSKEVFDDIDFFKSIAFIESSEGDETTEAPSPAEAFERSMWANGDAGETEPSESSLDEYTEEKFELTDLGENYVKDKRLWKGLTGAQREALKELKKKFNRAPLYSILRYVYKNYPDMREKSEIADQVLS